MKALKVFTIIFGIFLVLTGVLKSLGIGLSVDLELGAFTLTIQEESIFFIVAVNLFGGFAWIYSAFAKQHKYVLNTLLAMYSLIVSVIMLIWLIRLVYVVYGFTKTITLSFSLYLMIELAFISIPVIFILKKFFITRKGLK